MADTEWRFSAYCCKYNIIANINDFRILKTFAENDYNVDNYPQILSVYPKILKWANEYKEIAKSYNTQDYYSKRYALLDFLAEKHIYDMVVKTAQNIIKWKKELKEKCKPEAYLPGLLEEMADMNLIN